MPTLSLVDRIRYLGSKTKKVRRSYRVLVEFHGIVVADPKETAWPDPGTPIICVVERNRKRFETSAGLVLPCSTISFNNAAVKFDSTLFSAGRDAYLMPKLYSVRFESLRKRHPFACTIDLAQFASLASLQVRTVMVPVAIGERDIARLRITIHMAPGLNFPALPHRRSSSLSAARSPHRSKPSMFDTSSGRCVVDDSQRQALDALIASHEGSLGSAADDPVPDWSDLDAARPRVSDAFESGSFELRRRVTSLGSLGDHDYRSSFPGYTPGTTPTPLFSITERIQYGSISVAPTR
ncbi:C2 NT-type domain-containing protein [Plasmodiophora brassicae]